MARLRSDTPAGRLCLDRGFDLQLSRRSNGAPPQIDVPTEFGRSYNGRMSTQQIFGLVLTELSRSTERLHERVVTVSPDVASSTNLGGWINRAGVWAKRPQEEFPEELERRVRSGGTSPRRAATSSWAYPRTTCSWRWASSASPTR